MSLNPHRTSANSNFADFSLYYLLLSQGKGHFSIFPPSPRTLILFPHQMRHVYVLWCKMKCLFSDNKLYWYIDNWWGNSGKGSLSSFPVFPLQKKSKTISWSSLYFDESWTKFITSIMSNAWSHEYLFKKNCWIRFQCTSDPGATHIHRSR